MLPYKYIDFERELLLLHYLIILNSSKFTINNHYYNHPGKKMKT